MKILLETRCDFEQTIWLHTDEICTYRINSSNIFENWMIVLDKYSIMISQMYHNDGVFINTIFSFLLKLKSEAESLYYKQLHTRLLNRVKQFLLHQKIDNIYLYDCDPRIKEYLDIECFSYTIFTTRWDLVKEVMKNI